MKRTSTAAIGLAIALAAATPARAHAQEGHALSPPARVLVLSDRRTRAATRELVLDAIDDQTEIVPEQSYVRAARAHGLPASHPATLARLLPPERVDVAIWLRTVRRGRVSRLQLVFIDGRDGAPRLFEEHELELVPTLVPREVELVAAASRAGVYGRGEAVAGGAAPRAAPRARVLTQATDDERPPALGGHGPTPAVREDLDAADGSGDSEPAPEAHHEADADLPSPSAVVRLRLVAGLGIGMRTAKLPATAGIVRLSLGPFAAADAGLWLELEPVAGGALSLSSGVAYHTSVALVANDVRSDGSTQTASARSQRFEVALGARARLGASERAPAVELEAGWALRAYDSPAVLSVPDHTLSGPFARVLGELTVSLLTFSLGPEVQWIASVDDSLNAIGIEGSGWAIAGIASARLALSDSFGIELVYHESRALLSGADLEGEDIERWVMVNARYRP